MRQRSIAQWIQASLFDQWLLFYNDRFASDSNNALTWRFKHQPLSVNLSFEQSNYPGIFYEIIDLTGYQHTYLFAMFSSSEANPWEPCVKIGLRYIIARHNIEICGPTVVFVPKMWKLVYMGFPICRIEWCPVTKQQIIEKHSKWPPNPRWPQHNQDKIIIFILASWYVHNMSTCP